MMTDLGKNKSKITEKNIRGCGSRDFIHKVGPKVCILSISVYIKLCVYKSPLNLALSKSEVQGSPVTGKKYSQGHNIVEKHQFAT